MPHVGPSRSSSAWAAHTLVPFCPCKTCETPHHSGVNPGCIAGVSEASRKGGAESLIAGLGCTHPDSNRRAELLQKELSWMAANKAEARDAVGSKVNYWSL